MSDVFILAYIIDSLKQKRLLYFFSLSSFYLQPTETIKKKKKKEQCLQELSS